jgi:hypothetical protein
VFTRGFGFFATKTLDELTLNGNGLDRFPHLVFAPLPLTRALSAISDRRSASAISSVPAVLGQSSRSGASARRSASNLRADQAGAAYEEAALAALSDSETAFNRYAVRNRWRSVSGWERPGLLWDGLFSNFDPLDVEDLLATHLAVMA